MLLEELARDLVEIVSSLVGGRTINIMNTDGIIVASTEEQRIGSYHQGAREAALTGQPVQIRPDQLSEYAGAKQGINMPIRVDGTIIGVVGIFGNPEEIRDLARLLEVYATKYYQMEALLRPVLTEEAMRSQLLGMLLLPEKANHAAVQYLINQLNLQFSFPACVLVISAPRRLTLPEEAERLRTRLESMEIIHPAQDLWGILEGSMVIFASRGIEKSPEAFRPLMEEGYRVSRSRPCGTLWDFPISYYQARLLDLYGPNGWNDLNQEQGRCCFLMADSAQREAPLLAEMYQRFCTAVPEAEREILLESVQNYYDCDRSVTRASARMYIHKNTLQYRVRRVLDVLGLQGLSPFLQEYLIRLLLIHRRSILRPGSKGLE